MRIQSCESGVGGLSSNNWPETIPRDLEVGRCYVSQKRPRSQNNPAVTPRKNNPETLGHVLRSISPLSLSRFMVKRSYPIPHDTTGRSGNLEVSCTLWAEQINAMNYNLAILTCYRKSSADVVHFNTS